MEGVLESALVRAESKRLNFFERYLSLWVGSCMVAGIIIGKIMPDFVQTFRSMEFGQGSHINLPIAVLIWLMIIPMMMKVDFASVRNVGRRPKGLAVTLVVNWLVKPFSMRSSHGCSSGMSSPPGSRRLKPINILPGRLS